MLAYCSKEKVSRTTKGLHGLLAIECLVAAQNLNHDIMYRIDGITIKAQTLTRVISLLHIEIRFVSSLGIWMPIGYKFKHHVEM